MVFDISEVGNPQYNIPFVLDLHKPPVTSVEYVCECPDNLSSSLCSVQSKQLVKDKLFKVRTHLFMHFFICPEIKCNGLSQDRILCLTISENIC